MAFVLMSIVANAQFYISAGGGYSLKAGKKDLGSEITNTGINTIDGSYGEGFNVNLRGGYFFDEKWGVELLLGYLSGADQDVTKITATTLPQANVYARGRAFGASLSAVYNITDNFYARAGLLTKLGGRTEAVGSVVMPDVDARLFNSEAPPVTGDLAVDFTTDFHGKLPIGFTGAVGYRFPLADNLSLFAELDYLGINITRDTSELADFSANYLGNNLDRDTVLNGLKGLVAVLPEADPRRSTLSQFIPLLEDEATWGEGDLPSSEAPYSSIGFNVGITYKFGTGGSSTNE